MINIEAILEDSLKKATALNEKEKEKFRDAFKEMAKGYCFPAEALNLTPELLEAIYGYGYRLFNSGQYENALALFSYLFMLKGDESKYAFAAAACYHQMKNYEWAVEFYLASFFLDKTNVIPLFHASDCAIKLEADRAAFVFLGLAIELAQDTPRFSVVKERAKMMQNALRDKLEKAEPVKA